MFRSHSWPQIDKRTRLRRIGRIREKKESLICYNCRQSGHDLSNCPKNENGPKKAGAGCGEKICYKCGSISHTLRQCQSKGRSKGADLPFASCFICNKVGHLAIRCPQNDHGLYPNGGSCHFCGSIRHLASNCKTSANRKIEKGFGSSVIGQTNINQSADDDDMHVVLNEEYNESVQVRKHKRRKVVTM